MFKKWRINKLQVRLAELEAQLAAAKYVLSLIGEGSGVPGAVVLPHLNCPPKIAAIKAKLKCLGVEDE